MARLLRYALCCLLFVCTSFVQAQQTPLPPHEIAPLETPFVFWWEGGYGNSWFASQHDEYCHLAESPTYEDAINTWKSPSNICDAWVTQKYTWNPRSPCVGCYQTVCAPGLMFDWWVSGNPYLALDRTKAFDGAYSYYSPACDQEADRSSYVARQMTYYCPTGYTLSYQIDNQATTPETLYFDIKCLLDDTPDELQMCPAVGNPIHAKTGNKYQREVDYTGSGPFPLRFERHYRSDSAPRTTTLGTKWRHHYDRSIALNEQPNIQTASVFRPDGRVWYFNQDSDGDWLGSPEHTGQLSRIIDAITGTPIGWYYITGDDLVEHYNDSGQLLSITNLAGLSQTMDYSIDGDLTTLDKVTDPFGRSLQFTYYTTGADTGRLQTLTDADGQTYAYSYEPYTSNVLGSARLSTVTYPGNKTRAYHYNEQAYTNNTNLPHALTGITDENGDRFATYGYNSQGKAIFSEHNSGAERVDLVYNGNGTTTITDALGTARTYSFETHHGVIKIASISQPCNAGCGSDSANTSYDANGFVDTKTDFNGNVTDFTFDTRGLQTSRIEAQGSTEQRSITTQWHPTYRLPELITEPGKTTNLTYTAEGLLDTRTETDTATSATRTWTYDYYDGVELGGVLEGLLKTVDGPRTDVTDVTTYVYYTSDDPNGDYRVGDLHTLTNPLGHVTEFLKYDGHGRPLEIEDPNDILTVLTYHPRGWLTSRTVAAGTTAAATTTFTYDDVGQLDKVTLPNGAFLDYDYDAAHRLTDITDNLGNNIHYTLDAMGNRTGEDTYDPNNALTRSLGRVYNSLNRLEQQLGNHGQVVEFTYDNNGNLESRTDGFGTTSARTTDYTYDALDRLKTVIDPYNGLSHPTVYSYDPLDQLTAVTDPEHLTTSYTPNALGDLDDQTSPDTGVTDFSYDNAGNRTGQLDARGISVTYSYDALNRLTAIDYPDNSLDVTYSYDQGVNAIGRLSGMLDASGSTAYTYDERGNVTQISRTILGVIYTTDYDYDAADNLTQVIYPTGRIVDTPRDSLGRISSVSSTSLSSTETLASNLTYDPFGPVTGFTYGNGLQKALTFDLDGRLDDYQTGTNPTTATVQDIDLGYSVVDNLTTLTDGLDLSQSQTVSYDVLNRLDTASGGYGSVDYDYDGIGNRTQAVIDTGGGAQTDTYSYPPTSHRLQSITGPNGQSRGYDAAGNTTSIDNRSFNYGDHNRLSDVTDTSGTLASYTYNGNGERLIKTAGGETTVYHYDLNGQLIAETDASGNALNEYVYLGSMPLAVYQAGEASANTPAQLLSPTPNSTLVGASVTFTWEDASADGYWLTIGSTPTGGEYYDQDQGLATSVTVSGLPTDGSLVYVQLQTLFGAVWSSHDYQFTAAMQSGGGGDLLVFSTQGNSVIPTVASPYDDADVYGWDGSSFTREVDAQTDLSLASSDKVNGLDDSSATGLCLSFSNASTTLPGLGTVAREDVACEQSGTWSLFFDGSVAGLGSTSATDLDALSISGGVLYFSTQGPAAIPGVASPYDDADIYSWDGSSFARVWDASGAGLASNAQVDGLMIIDSDTFYLSFSRNDSYGGTVLPDSTVAYDEDVVLYDAGSWSLYFDGTAEGFDPANDGQDIDALDRFDPANKSLVVASSSTVQSTKAAKMATETVSFSTLSSSAVPGVASPFDDADIYRWDGSGFTREVDAQTDWGLSFSAKVNGLDEGTTQGLCVSFSSASTTVPGLGTVAREDVVCEQSGSWSLYFDGSVASLGSTSAYDLDAVSISGGVLYFSTQGAAAIPGVASPYDDADIYSWDGTSFARLFDASGAGLASHAQVDGLQFVDSDTWYLSFSRNDSYGGTVLPDSTVAYDEDVVLYDAGSWSMYFDGTAEGFDPANDGQDIDALDVATGSGGGGGNTSAAGLYYVHTDHLGTPRLLTDDSQTIVWRWDSAPFGDTAANDDPDGDGTAVTFNLRFPGQYYDGETGQHYNYFRDYDPSVGRYVQSDPIGLEGGINTYGYVSGNPLFWTDPLGLAHQGEIEIYDPWFGPDLIFKPINSTCGICEISGGDIGGGGGLRTNPWKFRPDRDVDWRGSGRNVRDALREAFRRTKVPEDEFTVTKWGKDKYGKSCPVEYRVISGPNRGAEVNVDLPHVHNGPMFPHVGYQTPGKGDNRIRGHILIDSVPFNR